MNLSSQDIDLDSAYAEMDKYELDLGDSLEWSESLIEDFEQE